MIQLTPTGEGWRISLDGTPFLATEEQLLRLRDAISRKFVRTEKVRRLAQQRWREKNFDVKRNPLGEHFVILPSQSGHRITVQAEAFVRALPAKEQPSAREYLAGKGYS